MRQLIRDLLIRLLQSKGYAVTRDRFDYVSETSKYRKILAQYCVGAGLDVGFGGDPITEAAVRIDLPQPYTRVGPFPVQLGGDCRSLYWFRDNVLDYVYSSHVLEDFAEAETGSILAEWIRVLKPGGKLVLLLPDQQRYLAYCRKTGQVSPEGIVGNPHHAIAHFGLSYVKDTAAALGTVMVHVQYPELDEYSFAVVFEKQFACPGTI
jgi:SAM-dependent methyltransferase